MSTTPTTQAERVASTRATRDVALALLRATNAASLLPISHPAVGEAVAKLASLLREHGGRVVLGIMSGGLCEVDGTPLEDDASELSRRLHTQQFGTLELSAQGDVASLLAGVECLTAPWNENSAAFAASLAERTRGALRLQAASLGALRARDGVTPGNGSGNASNADDHEGKLLIQALLASDAGALSPDALASTINASLATQNPDQVRAWRSRLSTALDLLDASDETLSREGRSRIAAAISALEPQVRGLLTSPPALGAGASRDAEARRAHEAEQARALRLLQVSHEQGSVQTPELLATIERATREGVLSPEAVMLCAKLCTLARSDHTQAERSDRALHALHASVERVLRDPAVHGYTPEDYRKRLGVLARRAPRAEKVPVFAGRTFDPRVQAACIAASIVQQADELGLDATGSVRFLAKRVGAIVACDNDAPLAALAHTLAALPQGEQAQGGDAQQGIRIAARELRAALSETSCLMPLVRRAGGGEGEREAGREGGRGAACEHALAILAALPDVPLAPLAQQFAMNGAAGLRRTLDVRLRAMPVEHVVELTHAMVAQAGVTPHLLALLEGLDPTRAHATMCDLLARSPASDRRGVLAALVRTGSPLPPGLLATALVDDDAAIVATGIEQLKKLDARAGAFAVHAALVHLDGAKRLSATRVDLLSRAGAGMLPHGPHALASLLDAWRWSLTGMRPRACALIAEALMPAAQYDDAVRAIVRSWSRSSGRLVSWLMSSEEGA